MNSIDDLCVKFEMLINDCWTVVFQDSKFQAYQYFENVTGTTASITHSSQYIGAEIFGLGETPGKLNHQGKRIRLETSDSMGYSSKGSGYSLYKHYPFYILKTTEFSCGILYDDLSCSCEFDFNNKISAFRGFRRTFSTQAGFLDFYICASAQANSVLRIVKNFGTNLLGRPILPPQWALGYLASSMTYSDSEQAEAELLHFPRNCKTEKQIPCSGFYLSSGYTLSEDSERNVFTWAKKIPEPERISNEFDEFNIQLIPNVKPWYLLSHPEYENAKEQDLFLREISYFWKGDSGSYAQGQYFDFRKPAAQNYWISKIREQLKGKGFKNAIWNDNNEYEVSSSTLTEKALQSLLMARASFKALKSEHLKSSDEPLVVSRSGCLGIHRYAAHTWSGDNSTSWESLRYNIVMSLNLSLGLWVGNGFDVGGFTGAKVSEELFCRWIEVGIFFPRFTIHSASWKEGSEVNSPWMFSASTQYIKSLIEFRHQLIGFLDSLYINAYLNFEPIVSSPCFEFNEYSFEKTQQFYFLLGKNLFVTPIAYENQKCLKINFPGTHCKWVDFETGTVFEGGSCYQIDSTIDRKIKIPFFILEGTGLLLLGSYGEPEFINGENVKKEQKYIYLIGSEDIEYEWYERHSHRLEKFIVNATSDTSFVTIVSLSRILIGMNGNIENTAYLSEIPENIEFRLPSHDTRKIRINIK